jgi:ABC-type glycerol-3-phosphate transport system permease component
MNKTTELFTEPKIHSQRGYRTSSIKNFLWLVLYAFIALFALFPLLWMIKLSLTPKYDFGFIPRSWTLKNYTAILQQKEVVQYFLNSFKISLGTICFTMPIGLISAFALARYHFKGRNFLALAFLVLPMLPSSAILVPLVSYFNKLRLFNTLSGVIIVNVVFSMPLAIWMLRNFIINTPKAIEEAAFLDGLSSLQTLFRITTPIIKPGIIAVVVYIFITSWNSYTFSYALTTSPSKRVLSQAILAFMGSWGTDYGGLTAIGMLMVFPPVLVFLVFQKSFVAGMFGQALK